MSALAVSPPDADPCQLALRFACHPRSGTYLASKRAAYPYVVARTFRLDAAPADMLTAVVQSAGGAILGEDRLHQRIVVEAGARAHITSQAAVPVHRMVKGEQASEAVTIEVADGGWAEWLPSPRLLFPQSRLRQTIDVTLADRGTLILADGFVAHDPTHRQRRFDHFASDIRVRDPNGQWLAIDRLAIEGAMFNDRGLSPWVAHGCLLALLPSGQLDAPAIVERTNNDWIANPRDGVYAAASVLPSRRGLAVRVAARDGSGLRDTVQSMWRMLRIELTGREPGSRRQS